MHTLIFIPIFLLALGLFFAICNNIAERMDWGASFWLDLGCALAALLLTWQILIRF